MQDAISLVFHQKNNIGSPSYQILLQTSKYLVPQLQGDQNQISRTVSVENDSPKHEIESVSTEDILAAEKAWKKGLDSLPKLKKPAKVV